MPFNTHGQTKGGKTALYRCWQDMRQRCLNPKNESYRNYGGRGIKVCERWESFENFVADVGPRPEGKRLDRINNDKGYEPGNVRWLSHREQMLNTRFSRRWIIDGRTFPSAKDAARFYGVSTESIRRWCRRKRRAGCSSEPVYPQWSETA